MEPPLIASPDQLVVRTTDGRRTKVPYTSFDQLAALDPGGAQRLVPSASRAQWRVLPYFGVATAVVVAGWALAVASSDNRYATGYVIYTLIAVFWIVLPNAAAYWGKRDIPFATLVYTVGMLGRRLPFVAALTAALLAILLFHLAFYPWPGTGGGEICDATP